MKIIDTADGSAALHGRARRRWLSDRASRRRACVFALRRISEVRA
jgi:hypothetical protein